MRHQLFIICLLTLFMAIGTAVCAVPALTASPETARAVPPDSFAAVRTAIGVLREDDLWVRFDDLAREYIFHRNIKAGLYRTCVREADRVHANRRLNRTWAEMADIYAAIRRSLQTLAQVAGELQRHRNLSVRHTGRSLQREAEDLQQIWLQTLHDAQTAATPITYPFQTLRQRLVLARRRLIVWYFAMEHHRLQSSRSSGR